MEGIKGIDVSCYNGKIDWKKVKAAGVQFAVLKIVSKSLSPDSRFEENWKGCVDNKITIKGVYNYSYATTVAKAQTDAKKVLEILNGRKTTVWLDVEDKCQMNLPKGKLVDIINAYAKVILNAGCSFGVYTGEYEYNNFMKPYGMPAYKMWIARYGKDNGTMDLKYEPHVPNIAGWQYTQKGKVNGISGNVDMDWFYESANKENKTTYGNKSANGNNTKNENKTKNESEVYDMQTIKKGSQGRIVRVWQVIVSAKVDGNFGKDTEAKTITFQKTHGLVPDGIVGYKTWRAGLESLK